MKKMTEENVNSSFAGESQAHVKYAVFAEQAEQEGKAGAARLFRAASFSEQVHARVHLGVLDGVGTTAENLAAAWAGEDFEIEEMYPAYLAVAELQEEPAAAESMSRALTAEKCHRELYDEARAAVEAGGDLEIEAIHVCSQCGYTGRGEAPARCPLCQAPKKYFHSF
jgi:rubrerythrin